MGKLLYLKASPRGRRSKSVMVANAFVEAYKRAHADDEVDTLDLFTAELPPFDGLTVQGKYTILHGERHSEVEGLAWQKVERVIDRFKSADKYLLAVPMWNFGIPYRLKQYIDIVVQPGYTFRYSREKGYEGLVVGKPVVAVYARGDAYTERQAETYDMQTRYLELILGFIGIRDIRRLVVEPTLMRGPEEARRRVEETVAEAKVLASAF
jgi:FMN-dependent NADH-azoreductase